MKKGTEIMEVKIGDVYLLNGTSIQYEVYDLTGMSKGVPNVDSVVFLERKGRPNLFSTSQQFISTTLRAFSRQFTKYPNRI